ncbi:hypothetical protein A2625_06975 [candidate division WOR-1 bacterium RIFCSPHIGHO2_01_FULL_53_15]|uniref:Organic solvent tolerance-like N-terminal domain-containing protein n=1 Tax=candidate division WOR-1 bacterium RIFCSPHIGHO2_01_FULL_53_15 TaxID=1802564 RepID=A0A1F4Q486_UNCSA|nr:MAG: hypothetical protein A2625_06975 [candidate division WOR-1 bacterium RIFCSPHIGHO2_01_FULL_53_15]OGC13229.1 MAG: hypothetical protein A3D23_01225 [candidate division WOR-1 bacterium RIFCSPHIGHO2_02_FULL_53_26]
MSYLRPIFIIAAVALTLGVFYWALFLPKDDISQRIYRTLKEQETRADLAFKKVSFEESTEGLKFWQLEAESAVVNKSTGLATLKNTRGIFFKNGKPVLKFRSPAALWDMAKKEIYLDQPLGNGPGYLFRANNLSWKFSAQEKIFLDGSPRVVIEPRGGSQVSLEAKRFEINSAEDSLTAFGEPIVHWREARVSSRLAGYYQREKKIKLRGDVRLAYNDISAWGAAADYLPEKQYVVLSGAAGAEQGESKLSGDKVMVSLKDRKISLVGKSKVVIPAGEVKKK